MKVTAVYLYVGTYTCSKYMMNVKNRTVFVTVIEHTSKLVLPMATVVSVILQCFTVFVATVAVWSLSWTVALRHYVPRYSTWVRRNVLWV